MLIHQFTTTVTIISQLEKQGRDQRLRSQAPMVEKIGNRAATIQSLGRAVNFPEIMLGFTCTLTKLTTCPFMKPQVMMATSLGRFPVARRSLITIRSRSLITLIIQYMITVTVISLLVHLAVVDAVKKKLKIAMGIVALHLGLAMAIVMMGNILIMVFQFILIVQR